MQPTQSFRVDDFIAGCIGGSCSVVVGHPLDTVKTRLQAGRGYKSLPHCVLSIYRKETAMGFFRGMSFPLASITIYNSVVFGFFSNAQRLISRYRHGDGRHPCGMADLAAASMLTGLMSVGLGAPVDLVKIRLQLQTQMVLAATSLARQRLHEPSRSPISLSSSLLEKEMKEKKERNSPRPSNICNIMTCREGKNLNLAGNVPSGSSIPLRSLGIPTAQSPYRGPLHCVSSILQTEGLPGLYRGAGAMVLRDVPGYMLYFIPYTVFCNLLKPDGTASLNPGCIVLAGGLAGSISWVTATPADVVKSRLQADAHPQRKYRGIVHCIVQSYKTEGAQVFFRGASVNAIRGFPMSATMFLTYELSLQFFRGL